MLIINDVPASCINQAAIEYHVPAKLIISVLRTEGGRIGSASRNKNGTVDYGPMQINSSWLSTLAPYGYNARSLQYNPCVNVRVGTWLLSKAIAHNKILWKGVGDYHSHTPQYNRTYYSKVNKEYRRLNSFLANLNRK